MRHLLPAILAAISTAHAESPVDLAPLKKWLARQDEFHSVSADFTQTRALRVLRDPVATPGRLWFSAPDSMRWELGTPAKTIVLRKGDGFIVMQPAKKKAERHSSAEVGKQMGGMAMMRFPPAKDLADFQRQFEVLAITTTENRCHVEAAPRDPQARKFLATMKLDFDTANGHLLSFEMALRDGSSMRNEFSNVRVNQRIDRTIFDCDLSGFEVQDARD